MMAKDDVTLNIGIDSDSAEKGIKDLTKNATSGLDKVEDKAKDAAKSFDRIGSEAKQNANKATKAFDGLKGSFGGVSKSALALGGVIAGAVAAAGLFRGIKAVTEAASIQQDAVNALNNSLKLTGEFSDAASSDIQNFASEIQKTTVFGDELILQQFALAKAFGASNEQAKQITTAATELAAATGKSLDEATRQVSKTLGGFAGELGEVNPAIKALTQEQLRNGEAAKILIDQYGGSAASQINTFSGGISQLQNAFGDLQESIGAIITTNPAVVSAISQIRSTIEGFISRISDNSQRINEFVQGIAEFAEGTVKILVNIADFTINAFNATRRGLVKFSVFVLKLPEQIKAGVLEAINNTIKEITRFTRFIDGALGTNLTDKFSFEDTLKSNDRAIKRSTLFIEVLENQITKLDKPIKTTIPEIKKVETGFMASAEQAKALKEEVDKAEDSVKDLAKAGEKPVEIITSVSSGDSEDPKTEKKTKESGENFGSSAISAISQGIDVAAEVFNQTIGGGFVDTFGSIIEGFKNIPQIFEEAFSKFDEIALSLTDSLAAGFLKVVERLPEFFAKAVKAFRQIGEVLIDAAPEIIGALLEGFIDLADVFLSELLPKLIRALPQIINKIVSLLPKLIQAIARSIRPIIQALIQAIPEIIQVLADNIGPITEALVLAMAEVSVALVDELILKGGIFRIAGALVKGMVQSIGGFVSGILSALSQLGGAVFQSLGKAFSSAISFPKVNLDPSDFFSRLGKILSFDNSFLKKLQDILDSFNPSKSGGFFSDGGGIGGVAGQVGGAISRGAKAIGLNQGGTVPSGFPNDNFPARLTSGEEVVNRDTSEMLRTFLNNQMSGGESKVVSINLQVGESELANVIFDLNQKGFRTA